MTLRKGINQRAVEQQKSAGNIIFSEKHSTSSMAIKFSAAPFSSHGKRKSYTE